jgi:hypothetical protein
MTCNVPHVSKEVGARESFKRHEAHGGIRSFSQNVAELEVIRTETTIG